MLNLTRRDFIKLTSAAALAMAVPVEVFAADKKKAALAVYGNFGRSSGAFIRIRARKAELDKTNGVIGKNSHCQTCGDLL